MSVNVVLEKVKLFRGIPREELANIQPFLKEVSARSGETLFKEGDGGDFMYILYAGKVQVSKSLTIRTSRESFESLEKSLIVLDDRDLPFFGEIALIIDEPRTATVQTLSDCRLWKLNKADFKDICEKSPGIGWRLLWNICHELCLHLRRANRDVLKLTTALSIAIRR